MITHKRKRVFSLCFFLAVVCTTALVLQNCGDGRTYDPKPGDVLSMTVTDDDETTLYTQEFKFYGVTSDGDVSDQDCSGCDYVTTIMLDEEEVSFVSGNLMRVQAFGEVMGPGDIEAFFQSEWDEYINGLADLGANVDDMSDLLEKINIDHDLFLQLYEDSAMTLGDFVTLMESMAEKLDAADNDDIMQLVDVLVAMNMTLDDFIDNLQEAGYTLSELIDLMHTEGLDFHEFYHEMAQYINSTGDTSMSDFLASLTQTSQYLPGTAAGPMDLRNGESGSGTISPGDIAKLAEAGVKIAQFVWDIIKDNEAVVDISEASTTLLRTDDQDLFHYYGAVESESYKYKISVRDSLIKSWELAYADFSIAGSYGAKHQSEGGWYVPSVYVKFYRAGADWPVYIKGSSIVTDGTNVGTIADPIPVITLQAKIEFGWVFQKKVKYFNFRISGKDGFSQTD